MKRIISMILAFIMMFTTLQISIFAQDSCTSSSEMISDLSLESEAEVTIDSSQDVYPEEVDNKTDNIPVDQSTDIVQIGEASTESMYDFDQRVTGETTQESATSDIGDDLSETSLAIIYHTDELSSEDDVSDVVADYAPEESVFDTIEATTLYASAIASGTCGDNLTWSVTDESVLAISGTGEMKNYNYSSSVPWYSYRSSIKSVIIEDGVTSIGDYAFYNCSSLIDITIPTSVTSIGNYAFYNCSSLIDITIPTSVTSIGNYAFEGCSSLIDITIPASVISIGYGAFGGCSNLTDIRVDEANEYYIDIDGVLFNYSLTDIIAYPAGKTANSYTFPNSVTNIERYAFAGCSSLIDITIPTSVTSIGNYAFEGCSSLIDITIPASVISIGYGAFGGCSNLTDIRVDEANEYYIDIDGVLFNYSFTDIIAYPAGKTVNSYTIPNSVTNIEWYAFAGCSSLTIINIPDSVTNIGWYAFSDCKKLESIVIPESVTSIGLSALNGCYNIKSITFLSSTTKISSLSYYWGYNSEPTIYGYANSTAQTYASNYDLTFVSLDGSILASGKCGNDLTWTLANDGTLIISGEGNIPDYRSNQQPPWYNFISAIASVIIEEGITGIGNYAFYTCSNLTDVTISNSVTSIDDYSFYDCSSLTSVSIGNGVTSIGERAFSSCSRLTSIIIPDSVTSIGEGAFYGCSRLTSVSIGNGVTSIGERAFSSCTRLKSIIIPDGVTSIGESAFYGCSSLTSVSIGNAITEISRSAFENCNSLVNVMISDSVTSISDYAFSGSSYSLKSITIPDSVVSIGYRAFCGHHYLANLTLGNSVEYIDEGAFSSCPLIGNLIIPESVLSIGRNAINMSSSYENSITFLSPTTELIDNAVYTTLIYGYEGSTAQTYAEKHSIAFISLGESPVITTTASGTCGENLSWVLTNDGELIVSGTGAMSDFESGSSPWYSYNSSITSVNIKNGITSIGDYAFEDCSLLKTVTIPHMVTSIGADAFRNCASLSHITILSQVLEIYDNEYTIPDTAVIYGYYNSTVQEYAEKYGRAFISLGESVLGVVASGACGYKLIWTLTDDGILTISGDGVMDNYTSYADVPWDDYRFSILSVNVKNGVTSIGDYSFHGCSCLANISMGSTVTNVGNYAFSGCSSLTEIVIGTNVTSIGDHAFSGCSSISTARVGGSVKVIGRGAFYNCSVLWKITILNPDAEIAAEDTIPIVTVIVGYNGSTAQTYAEQYGRTFTEINEVASGTCGADLTWLLTDDGALTISGDGEMFDYTSTYRLFSSTQNDSINTLVIECGVTSIGDYAFYYWSSLKSVTIPNSVTNIGDYAFYNCDDLRSVAIPNSVVNIGKHAFSNCSSIENIMLGNSLTNIGTRAFYACHGLTSVTIPDSVTSIGPGAFDSCSNLTSVTIPNSVTSIGYSAFLSCSSLTSITIPDSVTSIDLSAFAGCSKLTSITFLSPTTEIYDSEYTISDTATIYGYTGSTAQTYAEKYGRTFVSITTYASGTCGDNLTWVLTSDGKLIINGTGTMTDFESESAPWYSYNSYITSVDIKNGVMNICNHAFDDCTNLSSITFRSLTIEIYDSEFTIPSNAIIYGRDDSTAEIYANKYSRVFVSIEDSTEDDDSVEDVVEDPVEPSNPDPVTLTMNDVEMIRGDKAEIFISLSNCDGLVNALEIEFSFDTAQFELVPDECKWLISDASSNSFDSNTLCGTLMSESDGFDPNTKLFKLVLKAKESAEFKSSDVACTLTIKEDETQIAVASSKATATILDISRGDLTKDDIINRDDVFYILYYSIFGEEKYPINQDCDFTGDGFVDKNDALYLLYHCIFGAENYPLR